MFPSRKQVLEGNDAEDNDGTELIVPLSSSNVEAVRTFLPDVDLVPEPLSPPSPHGRKGGVTQEALGGSAAANAVSRRRATLSDSEDDEEDGKESPKAHAKNAAELLAQPTLMRATSAPTMQLHFRLRTPVQNQTKSRNAAVEETKGRTLAKTASMVLMRNATVRAMSVRELVANEKWREALRQHLHGQHAEEGVLFVDAVIALQNQPAQSMREHQVRARAIVEEFILDEAPTQILLSHATRTSVLQRYKADDTIGLVVAFKQAINEVVADLQSSSGLQSFFEDQIREGVVELSLARAQEP